MEGLMSRLQAMPAPDSCTRIPFPVPPPPALRAAAMTHTGMIRARNEDAYLTLPELGLFGLADGMGGAAAGDVAARMVLDNLQQTFEDADMTWPGDGEPPARPGRELLVAGLVRANRRIQIA